MKLIAVLFACAMLTTAAVALGATFVQDEDVRGAFLVSRPKQKPSTNTASSRPSRRRPKTPTPTPDPKPSPMPHGDTSGSTAKNKPTPMPVNAPRVGIGLTLFMRDNNGLAIRTDPSHVFQKGDRVRVLLETNADGYLYIFNTTNNGPAVMLYPNPELDEAGNFLQAHVPFEIPSSVAAEERLRWLAFDENAGDERLFFVFSREPLTGVPFEDELINFCRDAQSSCPWRPSTEVWSAIQKEMAQPLKTDKAKKFGEAQTPGEQDRGLGLAKDDPAPSVIMMASSKSGKLVATLDLIHK